MKCNSCEEEIEDEKVQYGDEGTVDEGKPLCETCKKLDRALREL